MHRQPVPVADGGALLGARLSERGSRLSVRSAGFLGGGVPPPEHAVQSLRAVGLDISSHRSRAVAPHFLDSAQLVVAMARQHLFDLATADPTGLAEVLHLRRSALEGCRSRPPSPHETLDSWVVRLGIGKDEGSSSLLLSLPTTPDPIGQDRREFDRVRDLLAQMTSTLAWLLVSA